MTKLITDEDLAAVGLERCNDNSCIFGAPGGMATNGGCRCDDRNTDVRWPVSARHAFKRTAMLARHIATERAKLSAAFLNECYAMEREIATLRADLAASQREVERLQLLLTEAQGELQNFEAIESANLKAEVARCRGLIAAIMEGDFADGEGGHQDATFNTDYREGVDALRYLAEIGRVEIVSEQGRRVVARWKS